MSLVQLARKFNSEKILLSSSNILFSSNSSPLRHLIKNLMSSLQDFGTPFGLIQAMSFVVFYQNKNTLIFCLNKNDFKRVAKSKFWYFLFSCYFPAWGWHIWTGEGNVWLEIWPAPIVTIGTNSDLYTLYFILFTLYFILWPAFIKGTFLGWPHCNLEPSAHFIWPLRDIDQLCDIYLYLYNVCNTVYSG